MKGLFGVFTAIIVSCTVIGCTPPIGVLGGGTTNAGKGDGLVASPKRTNYNIPQKFLRDEDLNVFMSYRGVLHTVPLDKVTISVIEYIEDPDKKNLVEPGEPYSFEGKGQKMILVEYNNLSDEYYIEVEDPLDMGGDGWGTDAPGISVIWK